MTKTLIQDHGIVGEKGTPGNIILKEDKQPEQESYTGIHTFILVDDDGETEVVVDFDNLEGIR